MAKITSKVRSTIEDVLGNQDNPATEETLQNVVTLLTELLAVTSGGSSFTSITLTDVLSVTPDNSYSQINLVYTT